MQRACTSRWGGGWVSGGHRRPDGLVAGGVRARVSMPSAVLLSRCEWETCVGGSGQDGDAPRLDERPLHGGDRGACEEMLGHPPDLPVEDEPKISRDRQGVREGEQPAELGWLRAPNVHRESA